MKYYDISVHDNGENIYDHFYRTIQYKLYYPLLFSLPFNYSKQTISSQENFLFNIAGGLQEVKIKIQNSVIKGYHEYKIAPPIELPLRLTPQYANIHDEEAVLVWMPNEHSINEEILKSKNSQGITIKELVNPVSVIIGHVPRGLGRLLKQCMDKNVQVTCLATGKPRQSFPPWPHFSQKGGGVVIPCEYILTCKKNEAQELISKIKSSFQNVQGGEGMKISVINM
ncbi:hypothetical protein HOLleu_38100 [Holothuria leucospilota]|uniref:Uncharacterized protein n=1 Tax=Holothuria leucospilota TaxID=206669 RepID=A0A9Q0YIW7_HOLLE|nr:hypothetical protein HOLleu_38100 [Holothuria leucospilota]